MSVHDFRHYRAPNGVADTKSFPVTASETFVAGEPVVVAAAGTLGECGDDPSAVDGIAAHAPVNSDGSTFSVGQPVTVHGTGSDQVFITKRFATDGAGTAATPALTSIGDLAGLTGPGTWYLDTGAANKICKVIGVQDAAGNNLGDPNVLPGTGVWVLFNFI